MHEYFNPSASIGFPSLPDIRPSPREAFLFIVYGKYNPQEKKKTPAPG